MFNEEIEKCDFVVTIPAVKGYSTLNVSHAAAVMLYELHKHIAKENVMTHIKPITKVEKDQMIKMFNSIFDNIRWGTKAKKETQQKLWKRVIGKAMLTKRESFAVMGFLRKMMYATEKQAGPEPRKSKVPAVKNRRGSARNLASGSVSARFGQLHNPSKALPPRRG